MTDRIRKALGDLKARQDAGEHMPCPRCGRDTMKENMSEARVFEPTAGRVRTVTVIPARISALPGIPTLAVQKKRVAAYARVSTNSEEQLTSYEAQVKHYTEYIQSKEYTDHWQFVSVYTEMLTPSLIQMHPTCTPIAPRAESWVHLSHFRSLSRVHLGLLGAPSRESKRETLTWR